MDDHLGKPINPARLIEVIDRWTCERTGSIAEPALERAAG